jgi:UPF0271 protein
VVVYVIDSPAIFLRKIHGKAVTVPEVADEVIDEESRLYFSLRNVRVEEAVEPYISRVIDTAKKTGDIHKLSVTDIKVLAKALELSDSVIVTDDYSIQNVARVLGIGVEAVTQPGISKAFKWVKICRGCGRRVDGDVCPVCGSEIILRRVKREKT